MERHMYSTERNVTTRSSLGNQHWVNQHIQPRPRHTSPPSLPCFVFPLFPRRWVPDTTPHTHTFPWLSHSSSARRHLSWKPVLSLPNPRRAPPRLRHQLLHGTLGQPHPSAARPLAGHGLCLAKVITNISLSQGTVLSYRGLVWDFFSPPSFTMR